MENFVVEQLRERIVSGQLPGATKLDQDALAAECGVSRMPVREALRRLNAEGLVTLLPHRGAVVAHLGFDDIVETYEMRGVLEGLAARRAAPEFDDARLAEIRLTLDAMAAPTDSDDWRTLNDRFHKLIEEPCGAPRLLALIERLAGQCEPYVRMYARVLDPCDIANDEHKVIYAACARRSPDELEQAVRMHFCRFGRTVAEFIGNRGD